jgi:uncharacterized protein YbbC (DUF1343 family)
MSMGIEIATVLRDLYPAQFEVTKLLLLTGNSETVRDLQQGAEAQEIVQTWSQGLVDFEKTRRKYLLYK